MLLIRAKNNVSTEGWRRWPSGPLPSCPTKHMIVAVSSEPPKAPAQAWRLCSTGQDSFTSSPPWPDCVVTHYLPATPPSQMVYSMLEPPSEGCVWLHDAQVSGRPGIPVFPGDDPQIKFESVSTLSSYSLPPRARLLTAAPAHSP